MRSKKKRNQKFLYACPYCETAYSTAKAATSCAKPIAKSFKLGDIIKFNGKAWRIANMSDGVYLERIPEWVLAFGWQDSRYHNRRENSYIQRNSLCGNAEIYKFDVKEAQKQMKLRVRQAKAAQKFVEMLGGKIES